MGNRAGRFAFQSADVIVIGKPTLAAATA